MVFLVSSIISFVIHSSFNVVISSSFPALKGHMCIGNFGWDTKVKRSCVLE